MHLNKVYFVIAFICVSVIATAQQPVYKFSFGTGKTADGYIPVTPGTKFNYKTGYGFSQGSIVKQVTGKNNIGFVTGDRPFYFSVMLPDGNYDVKLSLGDKESNSATTVRAENRRLFLSNFKTKKRRIENGGIHCAYP
jgi:hypothetical protein